MRHSLPKISISSPPKTETNWSQPNLISARNALGHHRYWIPELGQRMISVTDLLAGNATFKTLVWPTTALRLLG